MKGPLDRTKVVLRQLPPAITQAMLMEQIDTAFAGRYNWVSFRPGKTSQKHQSCSRAYIDFKRPEDVIDFAAFFNGHVFVNEKGSQYKTLVEYAPSQRVPKQWSKKDGREGSIHKDPEYLEFLDSIAKPVENLPSAEIQLERREAERAGAPKEAPIVTPLMDFVRQKRAAKAGPRRILSNGKLSRRAGGSSGGNAGSASSKRVSEKKRTPTTMYVLRESAKSTAGKDKSTYVLVPKRDDQKIFNNSATSGSASGSEVLEEESVSGTSGNPDSGKKKILLLKGRSQEVSNMSDNSMSQPQSVASSARITISSPALKQNQRGSGRIIRGILLNKETRQNQASVHRPEQQLHNLNLDKDRRPPRPPNFQSDSKDANGVPDEKAVNDLHGFREKQERRTRNKDRPDRGVWTLRRSDGSYASDESSSSGSQPSLSVGDSSEGVHGDVKIDMSSMRSGEIRTVGSGRSSHASSDNGSHRHGRRGMTHGVKDADGSYDGKPLRRGAASGHGSHEKQVWVQKASSGS